MQMTTFKEGGNKRFLIAGTFLISSLIMNSEALKLAITPSLSGRMVFMFSCVLPCIREALRPTAITLPVFWSMATMDGLSTTTLSLWMIRVLAVPRSMAISSVKKLNNPIGSSVFCVHIL